MADNEVWKVIESYENYEISNLGNVKNTNPNATNQKESEIAKLHIHRTQERGRKRKMTMSPD